MNCGKILTTVNGLMLLIFQPVAAQEVDLSELLKEKVFQHNEFVTDMNFGQKYSCNRLGELRDGSRVFTSDQGRRGERVHAMPCTVYFKDVKSVGGNIEEQKTSQAGIPSEIVEDERSWVNCLNDPLPVNEQMSLKISQGTTFSNSTVIQTGKKSTISGQLGIPLGKKGPTIGLQAGQALSFSRTDTDQSGTSNTRDETIARTVNVIVPPRTVHTVKLRTKRSNGYVDISGAIVVDADVEIYGVDPSTDEIIPATRIVAGDLKRFLPSEDLRTIQVKGQLHNTTMSNVQRVDSSRPATSSDCN